MDRLELRAVIRHGGPDTLNCVLQFDSPSSPVLLVDAAWTLESEHHPATDSSPSLISTPPGLSRSTSGHQNAGQFIATQLKSRYTVFRNESGTHDTFTTLGE